MPYYKSSFDPFPAKSRARGRGRGSGHSRGSRGSRGRISTAAAGVSSTARPQAIVAAQPSYDEAPLDEDESHDDFSEGEDMDRVIQSGKDARGGHVVGVESSLSDEKGGGDTSSLDVDFSELNRRMSEVELHTRLQIPGEFIGLLGVSFESYAGESEGVRDGSSDTVTAVNGSRTEAR